MLRTYALVAALIALMGAGAALYAKGRVDAAHVAEIADLKDKLRFAEVVNATWKKVAAEDAKRAADAASRAADLNSKIDELNAYIETMEDRDRVCLDEPDTERLRDLWTSP